MDFVTNIFNLKCWLNTFHLWLIRSMWRLQDGVISLLVNKKCPNSFGLTSFNIYVLHVGHQKVNLKDGALDNSPNYRASFMLSNFGCCRYRNLIFCRFQKSLFWVALNFIQGSVFISMVKGNLALGSQYYEAIMTLSFRLW